MLANDSHPTNVRNLRFETSGILTGGANELASQLANKLAKQDIGDQIRQYTLACVSKESLWRCTTTKGKLANKQWAY